MGKPICKHLQTDDLTVEPLHSWLEKPAKEHNLKYLLAHAEDGVIWGHFKEGKLITTGSNDVFPHFAFAKLHLSTLQQCRIFGKDAEVMLWQNDGEWKARLVKDTNGVTLIKEPQILWGTHGEKHEDKGFTLLWDGRQQGLKHAVPLTDITFEKHQKLKYPVRLLVHHYINYDDAGVARIYLSRLVSLTAKEITL